MTVEQLLRSLTIVKMERLATAYSRDLTYYFKIRDEHLHQIVYNPSHLYNEYTFNHYVGCYHRRKL